MNVFYQSLAAEGVNHLDEEESRHCIKVLRKRSGDPIVVIDGVGGVYDALITSADARRCTFAVQKKVVKPKNNFSIHIAIAPTKQTERMEWFVEKSVELGIDTITFIASENSERSHIKTVRLERVAVSAMKQSLKAYKTAIQAGTPFKVLLQSATEDQKFIAHVDTNNPVHLKDVARKGCGSIVLIGPEGDFSAEEVQAANQAGFAKVSLGPGRLRTETAGIAACHILNLLNT